MVKICVTLDFRSQKDGKRVSCAGISLHIAKNAIREKICAGKEVAKLSQKLAQIVRDVDIDFDFEGTKVSVPDLSKVTDFLRNFSHSTDDIY